jgi:hypothetical protein
VARQGAGKNKIDPIEARLVGSIFKNVYRLVHKMLCGQSRERSMMVKSISPRGASMSGKERIKMLGVRQGRDITQNRH